MTEAVRGHCRRMTDHQSAQDLRPGALDPTRQPRGPEPGTAVVQVAGDLDLHTGPALRSELLGRIEAGEPDLVVDMSEVGYLDSSGITVLISALKAARPAGGTVRLACCRPVVLELLQITGLARVFLVYATVEDALADPLGRVPQHG